MEGAFITDVHINNNIKAMIYRRMGASQISDFFGRDFVVNGVYMPIDCEVFG